MSIPQEMIDYLKTGQPIGDKEKAAILGCSAAEWIDAIDDERLDNEDKHALLAIIANQPACLDVIIRLSNQSAFGIAVAREIMSEKRRNEIADVVEQSGLSTATTDKGKKKAIALLVTDKKMYFWFFRILFSRAFLKALRGVVYDGESELRLNAIQALSTYEGDEVRAALIMALDDTNKKVRKEAERILRLKYGDEDIDALIEKETAILDELKESASKAKEWFSEIFEKIPGLSTILQSLSGAFDTISKASNKTISAVSEGISGLRSKFKTEGKTSE